MLTLFIFLSLGVAFAATDNLALLAGTLKTFQQAACDEKQMVLVCPIGTTISVTTAKYGNARIDNQGICNTSDPTFDDNRLKATCIYSNALQYSLLQTVVEVCHKNRQCMFNTSPKTLHHDPCPGQPTYIEVVYKCRPYEFRSKVTCENEQVNLLCNPRDRVAILSASFGRTEYESLQCAQPNGVMEETCLVNHATEKVMQICHGKRRCTVAANSTTFGDPCRPESRTYLKVVYTCVHQSVLQEQYVSAIESDERNLPSETHEGFDRNDLRAEFSPSPNVEGPQFQPRDNVSRDSSTASSSPPRARTNNGENQEKFYLYIIVSVTAGVLLVLGVVIGRLLVSRHKAKRDAKFHANNETLPNGFTDDISEIDADIDLTTPVPVPMQDTRIPETLLAERLHGERYYSDTRIPLSPAAIHGGHPVSTGVRVDLGNHMVGTDSLHTILRPENTRSMGTKTYYYG